MLWQATRWLCAASCKSSNKLTNNHMNHVKDHTYKTHTHEVTITCHKLRCVLYFIHDHTKERLNILLKLVKTCTMTVIFKYELLIVNVTRDTNTTSILDSYSHFTNKFPLFLSMTSLGAKRLEIYRSDMGIFWVQIRFIRRFFFKQGLRKKIKKTVIRTNRLIL